MTRKVILRRRKLSPKPQFVGWCRPDKDSRWKPVCDGHTEHQTLSRLLDIARDEQHRIALEQDRIVLPFGRDPNAEILGDSFNP